MNESRARFIQYYGRSEKEISGIADYVRKWWQKETEHRLRIAGEVTRQEFLFDLPWDMEQTAEYVRFEKEIDWLHQPGDDPEFVYQINRHRYWVCMGQAYALTKDERYAQCFARQMLHWICSNPIKEETKSKSWRTIEAGLRGENWIKAMRYFAGSPSLSDDVFTDFMEAMTLHGEYLMGCDGAFSMKSNWGILENSGLYEIGCMLKQTGHIERGTRFAKTAKERLLRELFIQVMDDGVHWEQSPMYHNEVLHCYLEVLRTAAFCGDTFPEGAIGRIRAMAMANRIWQRPDGCQPPGGDSDLTSVRDVLTASAWQFHDPVLKSGGYEQMDFEGIWDYGLFAARRYEELAAREPEGTFYGLLDSGNWYLRSSWKEDGDYLHLRMGSLGGGHGHFDRGHLGLIVGGEEILTDPGRYTYVDGELRRRLKSAGAHNTMTVDNREYAQCTDSWGVQGLLPTAARYSKQKGLYTLMECSHLGYQEKGKVQQRRVLAIGTRLYVVMDTCFGNGVYSIEQHFHPAPEMEVIAERSENTASPGMSFTVQGTRSRVRFQCVEQDVHMETESFEVSRHYNRKELGQRVTFQKKGRRIVSMATVICCEKPDCWQVRAVPVRAAMGGRILQEEEAMGIEITDGKDGFLVVNAHVDTGADCEYIGIRESFGLGRVMVSGIRDGIAEKDMTVLKW